MIPRVVTIVGAVLLVAGLIWQVWKPDFENARAQQVPASLEAQNTESNSQPNGNSATSTGQSGGVTAGTIIINPPRQVNNRQIIDQIASYMSRGNQFTQAWLKTDNTDIYFSDSDKWGDEVYNFLNTMLGISYAEQFKAAAGTAAMGTPDGHSFIGGGRWQEMRGKIYYLSQLIEELRKQ